MRTRRGITPVIAVVLLLMMSVTAAGGSYAWITTTTGQAQERTGAQLSTELAVRGLTCHGSTVALHLSNVGDRAVRSDTARLYLSEDGDLLATRSVNVTDIGFRTPGGNGEVRTVLSAAMDSSRRYTVELELADDRYVVEAGCTPDSALVSYWPFDEGGGTWANDSAVADNDGQMQNGAGWGSGWVGGAGVFDGVDDQMQVASTADLSVYDTFTGAAWVYPRNVSERSTLFRKAGNGRNYQLEIKSDARLGWTAQALDCSNWVSATSSLTLTQDAWNFVAITHDSGSGTTFHVNGSSEFIGNANRICGNGTGSFLAARGTGNNMNRFDGRIDDLRIYDAVIPDDRLDLLHSASR